MTSSERDATGGFLARLKQSIDELERRLSPAHLNAEKGAAGQPRRMPNGAALKFSMPDLASKAESIYSGRRAREKVFGKPLFAEPAWDIMLDLFIATHRNRSISISSACIAAAVPLSTGLRWVDTLVREGLLFREPDPYDRRRHILRLTHDGFDTVAAAIALA